MVAAVAAVMGKGVTLLYQGVHKCCTAARTLTQFRESSSLNLDESETKL
jgi:hypothetical protein